MACPIDQPYQPDPAGFWLGINYPWRGYGHDFGTAWGHDGLSTAATRSAVASDLAQLRDDGVRVVRWFVFGDGRAAPQHDDHLRTTGLDAATLADLGAWLELADAADIDLIPVLFDYLWFDTATTYAGVELGGHSRMASDTALRQRLIDNAVQPLVERCATHRRIIAWDVINEPEWAMQGDVTLVGEPVPAAVMQGFVDEVTAIIHAATNRPVTLGSAGLEPMLSYWGGSSLDLLQLHHYVDAALTPVAELGVDRSVLLGEFATRNSNRSLTEMLDAALALGYRGALPWSFRADDDSSDYAAVREQLRAWARVHEPEINGTR